MEDVVVLCDYEVMKDADSGQLHETFREKGKVIRVELQAFHLDTVEGSDCREGHQSAGVGVHFWVCTEALIPL